jgi:hypothetical protein
VEGSLDRLVVGVAGQPQNVVVVPLRGGHHRILADSPDAATKSGSREFWRYAARGSLGGPALGRPSGGSRRRRRGVGAADAVHHLDHVDHLDRLGDVVPALGPTAAAATAADRDLGAVLADHDGSHAATYRYLDQLWSLHHTVSHRYRLVSCEWRGANLIAGAIRSELGRWNGIARRRSSGCR